MADCGADFVRPSALQADVYCTKCAGLLRLIGCDGDFAHIAIQVILNVAVVLNVIPTTGITSFYQLRGNFSPVFDD